MQTERNDEGGWVAAKRRTSLMELADAGEALAEMARRSVDGPTHDVEDMADTIEWAEQMLDVTSSYDRPKPRTQLVRLRRASGMTQRRLAERLGCDWLEVRAWERREEPVPARYADDLARDIFAVSESHLLEGTLPRFPTTDQFPTSDGGEE